MIFYYRKKFIYAYIIQCLFACDEALLTDIIGLNFAGDSSERET